MSTVYRRTMVLRHLANMTVMALSKIYYKNLKLAPFLKHSLLH